MNGEQQAINNNNNNDDDDDDDDEQEYKGNCNKRLKLKHEHQYNDNSTSTNVIGRLSRLGDQDTKCQLTPYEHCNEIIYDYSGQHVSVQQS
jgi:hypothetical protein